MGKKIIILTTKKNSSFNVPVVLQITIEIHMGIQDIVWSKLFLLYCSADISLKYHNVLFPKKKE